MKKLILIVMIISRIAAYVGAFYYNVERAQQPGQLEAFITEVHPSGKAHSALYFTILWDSHHISRTGFKGVLKIDQAEAHHLVGKIVRLSGRFESSRAPTNPGQRDNIHYNMSIGRLGFFEGQLLAGQENLWNQKGAKWYLRYYNFWQGVNRSLKQNADRVFQPNLAGLAKALILGDKKGLHPEISDLFRRNGLAHVLAVSGMHVGILFLILNGILIGLGIRLKPGFWLTVILLLSYNAIIGYNVSALRATMMILVFRYAVCFYLPYKAGNTFLFCMAAFLLVQPGAIASPSFWLSYTAVFSLLFILPPISKRFDKGKWIVSLRRYKVVDIGFRIFLATTVINLTTLPLMLYFFRGFSVVGYVVNVFVLPVVGLLYSFLLLGITLGSLVSELGQLCSFMASVLSSYIINIGQFFGRLPYAYVYRMPFTVWEWVIYGGLWIKVLELDMKWKGSRGLSALRKSVLVQVKR